MSKYVHSGDNLENEEAALPVQDAEQSVSEASGKEVGHSTLSGSAAGDEDAGQIGLHGSVADEEGTEQNTRSGSEARDDGGKHSALSGSVAGQEDAEQSGLSGSAADEEGTEQNTRSSGEARDDGGKHSALSGSAAGDENAGQVGLSGSAVEGENEEQSSESGDATGHGHALVDMEAARELGTPDDGSGEDTSGFMGITPDHQDEEPSSKQARTDASSPDEATPSTDEAGGESERAGEQGPQEAKGPSEEPKGSKANDSSTDPKQKKRDKELSNSIKESIMYWQGSDNISESLDETKDALIEVMGLGTSFDVVFREMSFGGRKAGLLFISGFAKDVIMDEILKRLTYLTPDDLSSDALTMFMDEYIPHIQVEESEHLSDAINKTMGGMSALFIEGASRVIIMDTRSYPVRGPEEPSIERVVRGARDGFTETLLSNVALVRRRLRDPGLKFELHTVGRRTQTDIALAYIDDIVDKTQVKAVTDKIKSVNIDGIPLADKQLEEAIIEKNWNPYPMVRYSERPDIVASHLLEGRVVVFVDTSPSVMVIPTTFFDLCQHAEENRQTPLMGSYLRWVRFAGIFASIFLLPLWMLFVLQPELKPAALEIIGPQENAKIPLLMQFLIIEFGVDLLRMAAVHTPTPLGSAMGLIAAILIGDIAVQTGLFVNEVVLYMAVAAIGMFATPSYELGLANRLVRLLLLLAAGLFHVPGLVIGSTLFIVLLTLNRSYNSSYLWPFIPFNAKAMGAILFRQPVLSGKTRPSFNKTRDNTRLDPAAGKKDKS